MKLSKYLANNTAYTTSTLSSIEKWFTVWVYSVDYHDKKNHSFKQHLVQGTQLQIWTTKNRKPHFQTVAG